ncbi:hypothetical protein [Saliphagus sp. LR7]|uniref:hypothetical protein n=1 Tax=Saliphagus sp. LR7 TaxID=2282654 RepID=UPI000DF7BA19|nr:hypothetical protein [Saliphagus sp. LR7]
MTTDQLPSMHHFESKEDYQEFVDELAANKSEAIEEWGAYEIATNVIAQVEDRTTEIQVGDKSAPDDDGINAPICPVTVLEYSDATSRLPRDEVESISHLAAELLEQDLEQ